LLFFLEAELELSKNGTANSSPATISVTSLIKEAERSTAAAAIDADNIEPAAKIGSVPTNGYLNGEGGLSDKQFLRDEYMAKVLGGRAAMDSGGRLKAHGGRAVRQVLSNNV
jgi:hypothetical protein